MRHILIALLLVACEGPKGPQGDNGAPGGTGPTGGVGPGGVAGATGPQGERGLDADGGEGQNGGNGDAGVPACPGLNAGETAGLFVSMTLSQPANGQFFAAGERAVATIKMQNRCGITLRPSDLGTANLYVYGPRTAFAKTASKLLNCITNRAAADKQHHFVNLKAPKFLDTSVTNLTQADDGTVTFTFSPITDEAAGTYTVGLYTKAVGNLDQAFTLGDLQIGSATVETYSSGATESSTCFDCHRSPGNLFAQMHHSRPSSTSPVGNWTLDQWPIGTCKSCHNTDGYSLNPIVRKVHGLHHGENQPAPGVAHPEYGLNNTDSTLVEYKNVGFPSMPGAEKDCAKCHADDRFKLKPSRLACGGCHENLFFDTGTFSPARVYGLFGPPILGDCTKDSDCAGYSATAVCDVNPASPNKGSCFTKCTATTPDCSGYGRYVICDTSSGVTQNMCIHDVHPAPQNDDSNCAQCHNESSTAISKISGAHEIPQRTQSPGIKLTNVLLYRTPSPSPAPTGGDVFQVGDLPTVYFNLSDNSVTPITDLKTNSAYSITALLAGPTENRQRVYPAGGKTLGTLTALGSGNYSYSFPSPIPATSQVPFNAPAPSVPPALEAGTYTLWFYVNKTVPVTVNFSSSTIRDVANAIVDFKFSDANLPVKPRRLVTEAACQSCHVNVQAHGGGRKDKVEMCSACHTQGAVDRGIDRPDQATGAACATAAFPSTCGPYQICMKYNPDILAFVPPGMPSPAPPSGGKDGYCRHRPDRSHARDQDRLRPDGPQHPLRPAARGLLRAQQRGPVHQQIRGRRLQQLGRRSLGDSPAARRAQLHQVPRRSGWNLLHRQSVRRRTELREQELRQQGVAHPVDAHLHLVPRQRLRLRPHADQHLDLERGPEGRDLRSLPRHRQRVLGEERAQDPRPLRAHLLTIANGGLKVTRWLTLAALFLLACSNARPVEDGRPRCLNWRDDVQALFAKDCASCHSGPSPAAGLDATSYQSVLQARDKLGTALTNMTHTQVAGDRAEVEQWVGTCDASYFHSYVHPGGILDPTSTDFHGEMVKNAGWSFDTCKKCHGDDFMGGAAKVSCYTCHSDGGPTGCTTCHGQPPKTGAHLKHVVDKKLDCTTCHVKPLLYTDAGHLDGKVEVTLEKGTWDGGRCSGTYCHGENFVDLSGKAFTDTSAKNTKPEWKGTNQAACGNCHGLPPSNHARANCIECHPKVIDGAGNLSAKHLDGKLSLGDESGTCSACHTVDPQKLSGAHAAHLTANFYRGPLDCKDCHQVPVNVYDPGHIDKAGGPPNHLRRAGHRQRIASDFQRHELQRQLVSPRRPAGLDRRTRRRLVRNLSRDPAAGLDARVQLAAQPVLDLPPDDHQLHGAPHPGRHAPQRSDRCAVACCCCCSPCPRQARGDRRLGADADRGTERSARRQGLHRGAALRDGVADGERHPPQIRRRLQDRDQRLGTAHAVERGRPAALRRSLQRRSRSRIHRGQICQAPHRAEARAADGVRRRRARGADGRRESDLQHLARPPALALWRRAGDPALHDRTRRRHGRNAARVARRLRTEVGISFSHISEDGRTLRQEFGGDARFRAHRTLTFSGFAMMSTVEKRLAEADLAGALSAVLVARGDGRLAPHRAGSVSAGGIDLERVRHRDARRGRRNRSTCGRSGGCVSRATITSCTTTPAMATAAARASPPRSARRGKP